MAMSKIASRSQAHFLKVDGPHLHGDVDYVCATQVTQVSSGILLFCFGEGFPLKTTDKKGLRFISNGHRASRATLLPAFNPKATTATCCD